MYSQVTFSHIPYSQAIQNGKAQDVIMAEILKMDNIHENWDAPEVMDKLLSLVN